MKNAKVRNASIILVVILAIFIFANKDALKSSDPQSGKFRFPASHLFGELRSASTAVEKKFAAQIAVLPAKKRKLASIGRPASPLENLRFGILEGKYALTMDGERIQDLSFVDTPDSDGRPTSVGSRLEFLSKFSALFGFSGSPQRVSVDIKDNKIIETYKAPAKSGNEMLIKVVLDNSDRLVSLHSEPKGNTKIF